MSFLGPILPYIQVVLAILAIVGVLLQRSEAGLGGAFGGGDTNTHFHTRRGAEKFIFIGTVVVSLLLVASAVLALL